jgi:hypothetical protein
MPTDLSIPVPLRATVAQILGRWYVRVKGQLAVGPLTSQLHAQNQADRLNMVMA